MQPAIILDAWNYNNCDNQNRNCHFHDQYKKKNMTRLVKIGIILAVVGSAMMFGRYVPTCEPNSMIQTLQTKSCDVFNVILLFATIYFSYVLIIAGAIMLLVNWISTKQKTKFE